MATTVLGPRPIALTGAPDGDMTSSDAPSPPVSAMQVDIPQDVVDELLESVRRGKQPQIFFGKAPQLRYGDKSHVLQSNAETHRCELYRSSGTGGDDDDDDDGDDDHDHDLEFASLINYSLTVQKAEDVTAGVDSALEQLRSNMAAISEFKEANKTIVGDATPGRTPSYNGHGHRRLPSTGFKAQQHLAPSKVGSPLVSASSSPMHRRAPTSQPGDSHDVVIKALRVPVIHLLARQPATEAWLAQTCRTSQANIRELLPKMAKRWSPDADKWQLTDKAFRDIDPYKFPYQSAQDRAQAIDSAIKSFDRQRLAKDDKLWQILLPREERGQGICLSRSKVKPPEAKPSTPMHKISDLTKKKPATTATTSTSTNSGSKKTDDKPADNHSKKMMLMKMTKEPEIKIKTVVREKAPRPSIKDVRLEPAKPPGSTTTAAARPTPPANRYTPSNDAAKVRTKKAPAGNLNSSPRVKPKPSAREPLHKNQAGRPIRPTMPISTKPKNPSPLSASPPVNASDFEDSHPVHKALAAAAAAATTTTTASAAASSAKPLQGNSDRNLKRKANDTDSDNHNLAAKKPHVDRSTPTHTPSHVTGRLPGSTPSSANSLKRKGDESSSSNTPSTAPKVRKVTTIDTGLASRYHNNNSNHNTQASPGASSSSTTSPSVPSLSFRQTVELSQRFQKYYKKYEELYWQLTESDKAPTEAQRNDLLKMHKKLEEMKKEIKAGAGVHR